MTQMGDKIAARRAMSAADVPTVPGSDGATTIVAARTAADEIGYPIMLKAAAGGGGKGMRIVESPDELEDSFGAAAAEAQAAFGDSRLYVEKVLAPARHVEVQVLCDSHGNVLTLGERECSIQRRHQKLVEESPSPALSPELREEMEAAAERACRAVGYVNAGTLEFILGPDGTFSFIELNARLQVEHPVTELCTGVDLVRAQLQVAASERLELAGRAPRRGHAIEVRLNAEDPTRGFLPSPGIVTRFLPPLGPGIRVDTYVEDGTEVTPHYDSLLAKLVVWDRDRDAALARAEGALAETVVEGVPSTRDFALRVLRSEEFRSGRYSTSTLAELAPVAA
jgi:acetyl-CoA carboxylase biotin carboxylase subunit